MKERGAVGLPFDLWSLEIFVTAAEAGSITVAARRLGVTQPAASQAIQQLERNLKVTLFDRALRPLVLTPSGVLLRDHAVELLGRARAIPAIIRDGASVKYPTLRIGLIDSVSRILSPALANALDDKATQIILYSGLSSSSHKENFIGRQFDIVILTEDIPGQTDWRSYTLVKEPYILLLPSHLSGEVPSLETLAATLPLARYSMRTHSGVNVGNFLKRHRISPPPGKEFDTTEPIIEMVEQGRHWAITTPLCLFSANYRKKRSFCSPIGSGLLSRKLVLMARRDELGRLPSQVAKLACDVLESQCEPQLRRQMPWLGTSFAIGAKAS